MEMVPLFNSLWIIKFSCTICFLPCLWSKNRWTDEGNQYMSPVESGHLLGASPRLGLLQAYLFFNLTITVWIRHCWAHFTDGELNPSMVRITQLVVRDCREIPIEAYLTPKLLQWLHLQSKYFLTDRKKVGMEARLSTQGMRAKSERLTYLFLWNPPAR